MSSFAVNFRATSGYVTDGANQTYSLGEVYPVTRGGITFGWDFDIGFNARDRDNTLNPRLAGTIFLANDNGVGTATFRLDLPSAGAWDITLAGGDTASDSTQTLVLIDANGAFHTYPNTAVSSGNFLDANNATYSAANWPANNTALRHTFPDTFFSLTIGAAAGSAGTHTSINSIGIASVAPAVTAGVGRTR